MAHENPPPDGAIPEEIRDACTALYADVAMLHLKWSFYRDLFQTVESAEVLSNSARAFFQTIQESLRNDMLMTICRLSDPSRDLARVNLSFACLLGKCADVAKVDNLVTAFQAASGNLRLYRNRYLPHNDPRSVLSPDEDFLPGVNRSQIDEVLRFAREILRAIYEHFTDTELEFPPSYAGSALELVALLKATQSPPGSV